MLCITSIYTKETQRLKEHLKNQVKHEWFYPTATFRGSLCAPVITTRGLKLKPNNAFKISVTDSCI